MESVTLSREVRDDVESGRLAHFTTIAKDGRPHTTIVWVGLHGDDVVVGKRTSDQKIVNIRRDEWVSLSIEAEGSQWGMQYHLIIEGSARVANGGAPALLRALSQRYVGPGTVFPPTPNPPDGFVIHVTPTRVRGLGPWSPMPGA